jgi:putative ABC transport system permease protein
VVGVVPAVAFTRIAAFSEIWTPIGTLPGDDYKRRLTGGFSGLVLARNRGDFPRLRAEFATRLDHYVFDDPKTFNKVEAGLDTTFESFARLMVPGDQMKNNPGMRIRLALLALALLFVTLPTLNLISINLSRILERASEIGVRKAFGASSRTLVGQFVVENVVLTVIGGLAAFLLSIAALALLNRMQLVPYLQFELNLRIFAWGMLIAAIFGVISGVYPAWRMSRMHPVNALRGGAR